MSIFQTARELFAKFGLEGVMGYFRPVSGYNKGKQSEFRERKYFKESSAKSRQKEKQEKISA